MHALLLATALLSTPSLLSPQNQGPAVLICAGGVVDQAGSTPCISASSIPTDGALYPLGEHLFVTPSGRIGMGTKTPGAGLEIRGAAGDPSSLRLTTTGAGSGHLRFVRDSSSPADWSMGIDPDTSDFRIYNHFQDVERLRIDPFGIVGATRFYAGGEAGGGSLGAFSDGRFFLGHTEGSTTYVAFSGDRFGVGIGLPLELNSTTFRQNKGIVFESPSTSASEPMIQMFDSGSANPDRMVLSHSEAFPNWGLRYDDNDDQFHFLADGSGVMTVRLRSPHGRVGIQVPNPTNILTIQQGSATDPIADAWTTYSSRRFKENIREIDDALDKVRELRGVTFDWKTDGKHDMGMIAEEVAEVVPEVVAMEENGIDAQGIDYARLSALLIEAVKEQDERIAELTERLERLEQD